MARSLRGSWWVAVVALALSACAPKEHKQDAPVPPEASDELPGQIVVDFKDGVTQAQIDAWEQDWGVDLHFNSIEGKDDGVAIASGVADLDGTLAKIRKNPSVESAEPLLEVHADFAPNDPDFSKQWNLQMIGMPKAWDISRGKGVIVAVLDTGIAYETRDDFVQLPDLAGVKFAPGYDFVNDDDHANDDQSHGSHVAGTIAQATNNDEGVAGIAFEATLMPVKVLDHFGRGTSADIADGIRWAVDHGAKVLNLSLGGGSYSSVMASAVEYAWKHGATVVCAAGNAARGKVEYPAAYPHAIAVGAVGPDGKKASYSSWGKELDLVAPGGDKSRFGVEGGILQNTIDQTDVGRSVYAYYNGTSMAAPHVAAVAALLYSAGAKTPGDVEKALIAGTSKAGESNGWNEEYGNGLLNAEGALRALAPSRFAPDFHPLWWAVVLLAAVLVTLGKRYRPGYLNVLFHPAFAVPLVLSTVGVFIAHWLSTRIAGSSAVELASLPLPDWDRWLFGRGRLASPFFYSALIPILGSVIAVPVKSMRPVVAGLAIGFAGFLGYAAWARAPGLAWLPFNVMAMPWLIFNVMVCLFVARGLLSKETAR